MASGGIKDVMTEWLELKTQLKSARSDISVPNNAGPLKERDTLSVRKWA